MSAKVVAPLIGALGVVVAAAIATFGGGGGGSPPQIVVVSPPAPAGTPTPPGQAEPPAPARPTTVTFRIHGSLGEDRLRARAIVHVDDALAGTLALDAENPTGVLEVRVARAGSHTWRLEGEALVVDEDGAIYPAGGAGHGTIEVADGDAFEIDVVGEDRLVLRRR